MQKPEFSEEKVAVFGRMKSVGHMKNENKLPDS
jgi:hypothetical protein